MTTLGNDGSDARLQSLYTAAMPGSGSDVHPGEDTWVRYAEGAAMAEERRQLADHLAGCAMCTDIWRAVDDVTRGAASVALAAAPVTPHAAWWLAAAAAAMLAVTAGLLVGTRGHARPVTTTIATAPEPSSAGEPAAPSTPPAPRAWAALPIAPAVALPASLTLTTRGQARDQAFLSAFGRAIAPYRAGRHAEAAERLEPLTRRFPGIAEGWFYLGTSRLLAGDAGNAIEPLRRGAVSDVVGSDARWFEAVALERAGRRAEADAAVRAMCAGAGPERDRACEAAGQER